MDVLDFAAVTTDSFFDTMSAYLGKTSPDDFTPEQWAASWMTKLNDPETQSLLPLPKTTKIPGALLAWDITTEDLIINYGPLDDQVLIATFYTVNWFTSLLREIWRKSGSYLSKRFDLGTWAASFDIARSPIIPWGQLIASSFALAFAHAATETPNPPKLEWSTEVFPWLISNALSRVTTDLFQTLADDLSTHIDQNDILRSMILGEAPYTNKGAATAGGYGSLYFDALYWQLASVHGILKADGSILQAPNNELVLLFEYVLPLLSLTKDQVLQVRSRNHVNKGNIMEAITLVVAEAGEHWLMCNVHMPFSSSSIRTQNILG